VQQDLAPSVLTIRASQFAARPVFDQPSSSGGQRDLCGGSRPYQYHHTPHRMPSGGSHRRIRASELDDQERDQRGPSAA